MPCGWLKTDDGAVVHINYGRGRSKPKICPFCEKGKVSKLCDFPMSEDGKKTCDAEMCDGCSRTLGRGEVRVSEHLIRPNDTIDVCPTHRGTAVVVDGKIFKHD